MSEDNVVNADFTPETEAQTLKDAVDGGKFERPEPVIEFVDIYNEQGEQVFTFHAMGDKIETHQGILVKFNKDGELMESFRPTVNQAVRIQYKTK